MPPVIGPQVTPEELLVQRSQAGHQRSKELSEQLGGIKTKQNKATSQEEQTELTDLTDRSN